EGQLSLLGHGVVNGRAMKLRVSRSAASWPRRTYGRSSSRKTSPGAGNVGTSNWGAVPLSSWPANQVSHLRGAEADSGRSLPAAWLSRLRSSPASRKRHTVTARRSGSLLLPTIPDTRVSAGPARALDRNGTSSGGTTLGRSV